MKKQARSAKKLTLTRETLKNLVDTQGIAGAATEFCSANCTITNRCSACSCTTLDC